MLRFRPDLVGGTRELLPCGLLGGVLVELFRKNKSKYYRYDFTVRSERYCGSVKEVNETRTQKAAALKLAAVIKGSDPLDSKPPTLREYSKDFLQWVEAGPLESNSAGITETAGGFRKRRRFRECVWTRSPKTRSRSSSFLDRPQTATTPCGRYEECLRNPRRAS